MQLTVQQEDLHRGLSAVSRAVPARSSLPIAGHILLDTGDSNLTLSATDAETIAITYTIASDIEEPGAITLPSRLLSDFVASLPQQPINLSLAERSRQVSLSCARNEASIGGQSADDFPPIPPVEDGDSLALDPTALRRAINQVVFAAATDNSRPVLTGIHFGIRGDHLRLAAADGFRLAVHTMELEGSPAEREAIVPARALGELARMLAEVEGPGGDALQRRRHTGAVRPRPRDAQRHAAPGHLPELRPVDPQHARDAHRDRGRRVHAGDAHRPRSSRATGPASCGSSPRRARTPRPGGC